MFVRFKIIYGVTTFDYYRLFQRGGLMAVVRSIVDKYEGSMTIKAQDGWFELRILLPAAKAPDVTGNIA